MELFHHELGWKRDFYLADKHQFMTLMDHPNKDLLNLCKVFVPVEEIRRKYCRMSPELDEFLKVLEENGRVLLEVRGLSDKQIRSTDVLMTMVEILYSKEIPQAMMDIKLIYSVLILDIPPMPELVGLLGDFLANEDYTDPKECLQVFRKLLRRRYPLTRMEHLLGTLRKSFPEDHIQNNVQIFTSKDGPFLFDPPPRDNNPTLLYWSTDESSQSSQTNTPLACESQII